MRKRVVSILMSLALAAGCFAGVPAKTVSAEEGYKYVYAALNWDEYWKSEGVYLSGDNWTASSEAKDAKGETDKGAFDTVTRATVNHGLHRGSYQCSAIIYDTDGNSYKVSHWSDDGKTIYLTDGTTVGWSRGTITKADGSAATMKDYEVTGIKYVPVAVETKDYEAFCKAYDVVENGGALRGGYGEQKLSAYNAEANVTANTNGLKTAVKNADGSFSFKARTTGEASGIADASLASAENITVTVKEASGSYGEFLRVDLTGDGYGALGAKMQAVKWTYYGDDETYTNALASYGTKFAADNWMHKVNGIQLGLTDSLRCQLPEGTDGTGYWAITVYALGYEDYTVKVQANAENIVKEQETEADTTELAAVINQAKALKKSDYCASSWAAMETELAEAQEELEKTHTQATVDEAKTHLQNAINALEKHAYGAEYVKKQATTTAEGQKAKKCSKCGAEVLTSKIAKVKVTAPKKITLKKTKAKLSSVKKTSMKVSWKKVSNASGYQIQYSTSSKFKNAKTVKVSAKKSSTTIKKLKKNKKYYVRVRSYNKSSGKTVYSSWSSKVSKKTKKK